MVWKAYLGQHQNTVVKWRFTTHKTRGNQNFYCLYPEVLFPILFKWKRKTTQRNQRCGASALDTPGGGCLQKQAHRSEPRVPLRWGWKSVFSRSNFIVCKNFVAFRTCLQVWMRACGVCSQVDLCEGRAATMCFFVVVDLGCGESCLFGRGCTSIKERDPRNTGPLKGTL